MLHALTTYAQNNLSDSEPGFAPKDIRWEIVLTGPQTATPVPCGDTSRKDYSGRTFKKCPHLEQRELIAGGITRSHFLADTLAVVTLFNEKEEPPDAKTQEKHRFFIQLLRDASGAMPQLSAVADLLDDETKLAHLNRELRELKAKATDKASFKVDGDYVLDSHLWHDWWREFRRSLSAEPRPEASTMRCFVTGNHISPALTHEKIRGLPGGLPTGDVLAGFDKEAFQSFGLEQGCNAAMSEESAKMYTAALNELIKNHSIRFPGVQITYWFKKTVPREDDPLPFLSEGQGRETGAQTENGTRIALNDARRLLRKIREGAKHGEKVDYLHDNQYYAATLSGMSGRVMLRDWMEGQFEDLVVAVNTWFDELEIVRLDGSIAYGPKFFAVLSATVRDPKDLPAPYVSAMWHSAMNHQARIPEQALARALDRFRVAIMTDEYVNPFSVAVIKACLNRTARLSKGGEPMLSPHLNTEHPNPAYQCGRLLAVYAKLQRAALGDVGAGVVQRYYAAASATPALVFGQLTRLAQFHLAKLESGGLTHWYNDQIAGIMQCIGDRMPATLSLTDQSLFALGYYQQIAEMNRKKETTTPEEEKNNE
ncbi:MAG: CRISPR-associated protein (Cas_Csd1) [Candidatus Latescibacteria bacterium ADurb.Bin168]|nr:MAG: CRISPR-associated protein (Cas_Csd1) [Candidatus Latescibacteria bacterium ADurb.Bin168]